MQALFFGLPPPSRLKAIASKRTVPNKQSHQGVRTHLAAPMTVHRGVKARTFGQGVCRIEKLARAKDTRRAVLQKNFHLTAQNKQPLRAARAMKTALKAHRALTQLTSTRCHQSRQTALRRAFSQRNPFVTKSCAAIGVGEQNNFFQRGHGQEPHKNKAPLSLTGRTRNTPLACTRRVSGIVQHKTHPTQHPRQTQKTP